MIGYVTEVKSLEIIASSMARIAAALEQVADNGQWLPMSAEPTSEEAPKKDNAESEARP